MMEHDEKMMEEPMQCVCVGHIFHSACIKMPQEDFKQGRDMIQFMFLKSKSRDFPGGPVIKTSPSSTGGVGSIPGWGVKIPHASWPKNQNITNSSNIVTNSIEDFKNGPRQKKNLKKKVNLFLY